MIYERVTPGTLSWKMYGYDHLQRYEFFKDHYKGKKILDAACGSGYGSNIMFENCASSVTGIDISEETIEQCKKSYPDKSIKFIKTSCEEIESLNEKFDLVISFETVEHLNNPSFFFDAVRKNLNTNGTFICSTPNIERFSMLGWGGENPFHLNELSFNDFKKLFEKHFTIQEIYHQSESLNFFRYMELKHSLSQLEQKLKATVSFRVEKFFRKIFGKPFQPISFYHNELNYFYPGDYVIELLKETAPWHKTYILVGKPR